MTRKIKLLLIAMSLLTVTVLALGLAACKDPHTHTFADGWQSDANYHWHAATCEHTDKVSGKAKHSFNGDKCSVCGYDKSNSSIDSDKTCTVTFDANGGSLSGNATQTLDTDALVEEPSDPTRTGYVFGGWAKDQAGTLLWNFATDKVSGDTTLYAKWLKVLSVTFNANGGKFSADLDTYTEEKTEGSTLSAPTLPTREYFEFTNWYKDSKLTEKWDFETDTVTKDTTLYAGWKYAEVDVTFVLNYADTENVVESTVDGLVAYIPTRTDYVFNGWWISEGQTADGEYILSQKWDTTDIVTETGLTLYAEWVEKATQSSQLTAPSVSINGSVFTWDSIENAVRYDVRVYKSGSNQEVTSANVTGTSWTFPSSYEAGFYNVKIRAIGDGLNTVNSVYVTKSYGHLILGGISNIDFDITTSVLTWTAVKNATSYELYIGGDLADTLTKTSFDLSKYDAGAYTVKIIAKRDNYQSSEATKTVEKKRLKTPAEVCAVAVMEPDGYKITWDSVSYADTYVLTIGGREIRLTDTSYVVSCSADYWTEQYLTVTLQAFDSNADYLISTATEELSLGRLHSLTVGSNIENAGETAVNGTVYVQRKYVVSFNMNGATTGSVDSQTVTRLEGLTYPSVPTRSGYIFRGWYLDKECTQMYDFSAEVTQDLKLYAGWHYLSTAPNNSLQIIDFTSGYNSSANEYCASNQNTTSSKPNYVYFCALTDGSYTFYYKNGATSVYSSTYFYLYNLTQNTVVFQTYTYSTNYLKINFTANAGDVFYVRNYRYYAGYDYTADYYFYLTGAQLPSAGGKIENREYLEANSSRLSNVIVPCGEDISIKATTKDNRYIFDGWYDGETLLTDQLTYTFTMPDGNVNFTAKWTYYALTAEKNIEEAGTVSSYSDTPVKSGSNVTVTATTNNGYTFLGWYENETLLSTELSYTFTMPSESVVYTAKWMVCPVTLVKSIEEAGEVSGVDVTRIGEDVTLTAATNDGYTFLGWYEGETLLTEQTTYSFVMSETARTLTAKWTYYTLTTNTNDEDGGTFTVKNGEKVTAGASVTLTATPDTGYTWIGWYNGDELLSSDRSYTFTMPARNEVYTAKWMSCPVTVEKSIDGAGSVSGLDNGTYLGQEITLAATTNAGYTWLGWYEDDELLTTESTYSFVMAATARAITAKWAAYTLTTVAGNSAAGSVTEYEEEKIAAGTSVTVVATTNLGYNFLGWFEEEELLSEEESYTFDMPASSVEYTAKWSSYTVTVQTEEGGTVTAHNAYVVTFHKNTGSENDVYAKQYVSAVQPLTKLANPTESYKVFRGWYNEPECNTLFDFSATVTEDKDVYAKWYSYGRGSATLCESISSFDGSVKSASYGTTFRSSSTTASTGCCYYFSVLTGGNYKLTIQNYSNTWSMGYELYNATRGVSVKSGTLAKSANVAMTFAANASDVFWLVQYNKSSTTISDVSSSVFLEKVSTVEPFVGGYGAGIGEISVDEEKVVALGERVILTAVPKTGYTFLGWFKDDETEPESLELDYSVIMTDENITYTAKWAETE